MNSKLSSILLMGKAISKVIMIGMITIGMIMIEMLANIIDTSAQQEDILFFYLT